MYFLNLFLWKAIKQPEIKTITGNLGLCAIISSLVKQ